MMPAKRALAWGPSLGVLGGGLLAWLSAMTGLDALAMRLSSVTVVLGFVASLFGWVAGRALVGYVAFLGPKLVAFFGLAPAGVKSVLLSYAQQRQHGLGDDWLRWFWELPPLLLCIGIVESWALSQHLTGRSLLETKLWERRRLIGAIAAVVLALGLGWRLFGVEFHLWRLKAGHAPARYSLEKTGPRALSPIYREIHALGTADVGSYRSDLVAIIRDIRYRSIARRINSPVVWEVEATLVDVEPSMADALRTAFVREPRREELYRMTIWAGELDFNTQIELFCTALPELDPGRQGELVTMIDPSVRRATTAFDATVRPPRWDSTYPWGERSQAEIRETQARMRDRLRCVAPLLVGMLERDGPTWDHDVPLWGTQAVRMLGRLAPLPDALGARLVALMPRLRNDYLTHVAREELSKELERPRPNGP